MKAMKRSTILILALAIIFFTIPTVQAATSNSDLSGIQLLPKDNIWNVPIDTLPVDPHSDTWTYNVRLYTSNGGGGDWENKTEYIVISAVGHAPVSHFYMNVSGVL